MRTTIAALIAIVPLATACWQPAEKHLTIVENLTRYDARMFLYHPQGGQQNKFFLVERETHEVIHDSRMSTLIFCAHDYDSIRISFDSGRTHLFLNDTIFEPHDIYDGFNWAREVEDHYHSTKRYILTPAMATPE